MKFPLPRNLFPPVEPSRDEMDALRRCGDKVVRETRDSFQEYLSTQREQVDQDEWKLLRRDPQLAVYKERGAAAAQRREQERLRENEYEYSGVYKPHMLAVGKLQGTVEDCMLGLSAPTSRQMQLKSACVDDGYVDWVVLASLERPTPAEPFRELSLKWTVKTHPFLVDAVMRARDLVYLEATGFTTVSGPDGDEQPLGYHVKHSVELPEARELTEFKVVRGTFTFCYLYRQRSAGVVDVFMHGAVSAKGDAPEALAVVTATEIVVSIPKNLEVAQMLKLIYLVRTATPPTGVATAKPATACDLCNRTVKPVPLSVTSKICCVCCARVCKNCRVAHTMRDVTRYTPGVTSHKLTFCVRCVHEALLLPAEMVAAHALRESADDAVFAGSPEPEARSCK